MAGKKYHVCSRCQRFGFVLRKGTFKPEFKCEGCDASWSYGYSGGLYFSHARNVGETSPIDWVDYPDGNEAKLVKETVDE